MPAYSGKASKAGRRDRFLGRDEYMLATVKTLRKWGLSVERYSKWMAEVTERRGPDFLSDVDMPL